MVTTKMRLEEIFKELSRRLKLYLRSKLQNSKLKVKKIHC